jgi:GH24 family phage-related lysozyme (muramidase)
MSDPIVKTRLILDEGEKLIVYVDTRSNATGGIGHRIRPADNLWPGEPITQACCDAWFEVDYAAALKAASAYPWYADLDAARQRIVTCMIFNLGPSKFGEFKLCIAAIEKGDYTEVSAQMLNSQWAVEVGNRAVIYARVMETGVWE